MQINNNNNKKKKEMNILGKKVRSFSENYLPSHGVWYKFDLFPLLHYGNGCGKTRLWNIHRRQIGRHVKQWTRCLRDVFGGSLCKKQIQFWSKVSLTLLRSLYETSDRSPDNDSDDDFLEDDFLEDPMYCAEGGSDSEGPQGIGNEDDVDRPRKNKRRSKMGQVSRMHTVRIVQKRPNRRIAYLLNYLSDYKDIICINSQLSVLLPTRFWLLW